YYWCVEYDVTFTGKWSKLFQSFAANSSDLLICHLRNQSEEPDWEWWRSLKMPSHSPSSQSNDVAPLRAFTPISRWSHALLMLLKPALKDGWRGHMEVLVPTLAIANGLQVSDFGEDRFYTSFSSADGILPFGSMRYRPAHFLPLLKENFLYHPVKPDT